MREWAIRGAVVLLASAIACFVMVALYQVQPIQIIQVTVEASRTQSVSQETGSSLSSQTEPEEKENPGGEASQGTGEQPVLVERSINPNTAAASELDRLPGVGPATAQRIISYREENNGFADLEELKEVYGIGEKLFAKMEPYLTLGERSP